MESLFQTSFADVRVHVGPEALSLGALAFTAGSNIYFAPSHYAPETPHGRRLLAHELAHVVQQRAGRVRAPSGPGMAVVHDPGLEAEAERMSLRAAAGSLRPPHVMPPPRTAVQPAGLRGNGQVRRQASSRLFFAVLPYPTTRRPANPTVVQRAASASRVLRKDQVYREMEPYHIVTADGLIREIVGYSIMPDGQVKDTWGSLYSFIRSGGGAGYQGLTKDPLSHVPEIHKVLATKGGGVIAAIDLSKITAPYFDLTDPSVESTVKTTLFQQGKNLNVKIPQLAGEGVVAVGGQVVASAITALVSVPGEITQEDLLRVLQGLMSAKAETTIVSQHPDQPWPSGEPRFYIQQSDFQYNIERLGGEIRVTFFQQGSHGKNKKAAVKIDGHSGEILSTESTSNWSPPELQAAQEEARQLAGRSLHSVKSF